MMQVIPTIQKHRIVAITKDVPWKVGRVAEVDDDLGTFLVSRGYATRVPAQPQIERAVAPPPETRRRRRKADDEDTGSEAVEVSID